MIPITIRIYRIKRSIGTKPASCAISVRFHSLINPSDLNLKEYIAVIAMTNSLRVAAMVATKYSKPVWKLWLSLVSFFNFTPVLTKLFSVGLSLGTKKMEYKGKQWHESCFCCFKCKTSIGNKTFIPRENDIFCTDCFEERYATRCVKCSEVRIILFCYIILYSIEAFLLIRVNSSLFCFLIICL